MSNSPSMSSRPDKVKRGYRACLHCRSRKAKCDLGDIEAPSSPPCSRCRRESRECVFAPSRRGGNNGNGRLKAEPEEGYPFPGSIQNVLRSPVSTFYRESSPEESPSPKRRRLDPPHAADPNSIVVADIQNESDALHILAVASARDKTTEPAKTRPPKRKDALEDFALIKLGILDAEQTARLAETFFCFHHHLFPMVPSAIIPRTAAQLALFAQNERYLLAAMIIIASRHASGMRQVHDRSWAVMRGWLSDIQCLGAPPTIGLVEALLLLAENLPRDPSSLRDGIRAMGIGEEVHGAENRQAWMLIGMAIRSAYGLGIDKLALQLFTEAERTLELERSRLAWTYCYLFDRHASLRLGKAFWSRGPVVCFQGFSSSAQTGPAAAPGNFPFLREIKGEHPQDDLAGLVQAYVELTQLMSNAHDCLYPNAARTKALVVYGEYFKYIDELARSLDGFKVLWRQKKWNVFPLTDAVWAMFHYTQLYICAFSFQAHVQRAAIRAEEERRTSGPGPHLSLFPRGAAASPDARYIFQSCDAAHALLHICVDNLYPGGALPYLPSRFLLWFTYGALVLFKALYSGAMLRADHAETLNLIDRLCACFAQASNDEDHPAVRYGRQLEALRKKLSGTTNANSPNRVPADLPDRYCQPFKQNASPSWTPPGPSQAQSFSFSYPTTPIPTGSMPYVAPPHSQPMSDIGNLHPQQMNVNDLGFATLDDWFGQPENTDDALFGGLDLQDFWMKVGPGEAQGGFPFR